MTINLKRIITSISVSIAIIFLFVLITLAYTHRNQLKQLVQPKPENFTELYFQNSASLPTQLPSPTPRLYRRVNSKQTTTQYSFAFTIHNLENRNMNYFYQVYELGTKKIVLDQKTLPINNGESKTITENFSMPLIYPSTQVVVSLSGKNQHIAFWMEGKSK